MVAGGAYTSPVITSYAVSDSEPLQNIDTSRTYNLGLNDFTVICSSSGQTADITFYLDKVYDTSTWDYVKYYEATDTFKVLGDQVQYVTNSNGVVDVTTIALSITDGGEWSYQRYHR